MIDDEENHTEESPLLESPSATNGETGGAEPEADAVNKLVGYVRGTLIIISLGVLILVQAMNITMLTTTQSVIAADLDAFSEASWLTSSYLIALSSIAPLFGRLSQIFSPRTCISVATIISAAGGLVTSSASGLVHFLVGRAIMGVGAAGVMTVATILVLEAAGQKRRGLFIGCLNSGFTAGVALGAVVAGQLLPLIGWRALFWTQAPLFAAAGVTLYIGIPVLPVEEVKSVEGQQLLQKIRQIDFLGAILLSTSILFFLYAFSAVSILIWPIIVSLILFPCFIYNEVRISADPIIPVTVLKSRGALLSCFATLGLMMSRWMVLFYTPVWAIAVRGWSPASAGSILVPTNAGFAVGGLLAGWIHIRRAGSFWAACILTIALFSGTEYILSQVSNTETKAWAYFLLTFVNGAGTGASLNYTLAHLLHLTLPKTHFITISLLATFRGFGGTFGSTIGGGIFQRILKSTLETGFAEKGLRGRGELIRELLGSPASVSHLTGAEHQVAVGAYVAALKGVFIAGGILSTLMIIVQAGTGWTAPEEEAESEVIVS